MGNLGQGVENRGIEKGMAKGMERGMAKGIAKGMVLGAERAKLEDIQNLVQSLNLSLEQAMNALDIPADDQKRFSALLRKQ